MWVRVLVAVVVLYNFFFRLLTYKRCSLLHMRFIPVSRTSVGIIIKTK